MGVATGLALYRIARQSLKPRYAVALASVSLLLWLVQIMVIFFVYSNWEPCATEDTSWEWNIVGNWANMSVKESNSSTVKYISSNGQY